MPGSSSWMPYAPQGVKGPDDDDDEVLKGTTFIKISNHSHPTMPQFLVPLGLIAVMAAPPQWVAFHLQTC